MRRSAIAAVALLLLPLAASALTATPSPSRTPTVTPSPTITPTFAANDVIQPFAPESWVYDKTICKGPVEITVAGTLKTRAGTCKQAAGTMQDCIPLDPNYDGGAFRFATGIISTKPGSTDAGDLLTVSISCQCGGSGDVITSTYGTPQTNTYDLGNVATNGRLRGETAAVTCAGTCQPLDVMCWKALISETDQPEYTWFEWLYARLGRN